MQDKLRSYLRELEKENNNLDNIKFAKKSFGDFYRKFYFEKMGGFDWNDPLLLRCSKITDLGLKNGL